MNIPDDTPATLLRNVLQGMVTLLETHRQAHTLHVPRHYLTRWIEQLQEAERRLEQQREHRGAPGGAPRKEHPMHDFPLLHIKDALADADRNLADVVSYVHTLQADSEGQYPPDAQAFLGHIAILRELLRGIVPEGLQRAIAEEQAEYDDQESRWEPSG